MAKSTALEARARPIRPIRGASARDSALSPRDRAAALWACACCAASHPLSVSPSLALARAIPRVPTDSMGILLARIRGLRVKGAAIAEWRSLCTCFS